MTVTVNTPIKSIGGIGPAKLSLFGKLGIATVKDLLWYAPFRYDDFSRVSPIALVRPEETVTIRGAIESVKTFRTKSGKQILEAVIADDSGKIRAVWFNQIYLLRLFRAGMIASLSGDVCWFGNKLVISNPDYEIMSQFQALSDKASLHTGRLVPVYPETAGLSSKYLRSKISYLLDLVGSQLVEHIPDYLIDKHKLMRLPQAIKAMHFPNFMEEAIEAKRRLAFEELLTVHLIARGRRRHWRQLQQAHAVRLTEAQKQAFTSALPFQLTQDQNKAISDILADIAKPYPANRLLIGDVGSGKTVVAAMAMYAMHVCGLGSVLMAPTEILAQQHFKTLSQFLTPLGMKVELVTAESNKIKLQQAKKKNKQASAKQTEQMFIEQDNSSDVYVGTHALLSKSVDLSNIGLVVIDEQHRFGVDQRQLLRTKSGGKLSAHLITMTATPIPRTIALTLYGNLDLSVISQMPEGRKVVKTWVVPSQKRDSAYDWIRKQISETGGQIFIICPLVDTSESLASVKAVNEEYEVLKREIFPDFDIGMLHGRMKPAEKSRVLADFSARKTQILLTTPVVEVGIDVPNATIMMIEAAERFGLGQLHQLRGRVGRGDKQSFCLLFSQSSDEVAVSRLKLLEKYHNGPELAEADLALRGPGEMFGTRQHGSMNLRYAQWSDAALIEETAEAANLLLKRNPDLENIGPLSQIVKQGIMEGSSVD